MNKSFLIIFLLIMMIMMTPASAFADRADDLQLEIQSRQEQLTKHQMVIDRLSQEEREIYSRLAEAEDRLEEISRTLDSRESELDDIVVREARIAADYEQLAREKSSTREELAALLESIWPIFLQSQGKGLAEIEEWSDLDREINWLGAIFRQAEEIYSLLQAQSGDLASALVRLQIMKDEFQAGLSQVNRTKDQLLNEKLGFLKELQEIRAKKLAGEEMISEIIDVIDSLNYQLNVTTHREFSALKGHLIWPARGRLAFSYNQSGDPPHNGLSISLDENSPVQAISWGKVMHNDTLRGFGRVVILFHGDDYYSLYAYLSESTLQIGQEVEKGETIGLAGYYPRINSNGIYFELRFKQKAINPVPWLEQS